MKLNYGSLAVLITALVFLAFRFWGHPWNAERAAGALLLVPSFILLVVARLQFGAGFHGGPRSGCLITTGLYAKVRHPVYIVWQPDAGRHHAVCEPDLVSSRRFGSSTAKDLSVPQRRSHAAAHFGATYTEYKQQTWF
jgi:hypothetical protein